MLEDIAILTGGTAIMKDLGMELETVTLAHLGRPRRSRSPRTTRRSSRAPAHADIKADRPDPREIERPTSTTTARSSRSVSPSSPAASPRSTSAPAARPSSRRRRPASRTRCTPRVPPSTRASFPAAASRFMRADAALDKARKAPRGDEKLGVDILRRGARGAPAHHRGQRRREGPRRRRKVARARASNGFNALTGEYGDLIETASSRPPRSTAPRCRTPPASPACC